MKTIEDFKHTGFSIPKKDEFHRLLLRGGWWEHCARLAKEGQFAEWVTELPEPARITDAGSLEDWRKHLPVSDFFDEASATTASRDTLRTAALQLHVSLANSYFSRKNRRLIDLVHHSGLPYSVSP